MGGGRQANGILLLVGWGFDWWTRWQPAHLRFEVFTPKGYSSYSKVTVPEDVSYVTSPFMIGALRRSQDVPITNNAERAAVRKITIQTLQVGLHGGCEEEMVHTGGCAWRPHDEGREGHFSANEYRCDHL